ncbi:hypothetical protein BJ912DRAFT_1123799 [Pholiota molesta]|nr:hypothetical protein BJ912DRAFT_1123799 [Pholiota molesta]
MALRYELPYFFDDATGRLSGSTFVEFHERMRINYIKRVDNESQSEYDIYKHSNEAEDQDGPAATLYFGPNHTLGTIQYRNQEPKNMDHSKLRRFIASDGNEYRWGWRKVEGDLWTCTNGNGEIIADYSFKPPMEPAYITSGICLPSLKTSVI